MSSYIEFMFKYLFSADDDYSAGELAPLSNASQLLLLAGQPSQPAAVAKPRAQLAAQPDEEPVSAGSRMQQQAAAKCLELTRKLTLVQQLQQQQQHSQQQQQQPPMRSFADFESWFRAALANQTNHEPASSNATRMATGLLEAAARTAVHSYPAASNSSGYSIANGVHLNDDHQQQHHHHQQQQQHHLQQQHHHQQHHLQQHHHQHHHQANLTSREEESFTSLLAAKDLEHLDLLECYHQMQLKEYYSQYDIFIGLRIASTLTILFIVFILFVIYKTGCRDNQNQQQQQQRQQQPQSLLVLGGGGGQSATASTTAGQCKSDCKLAWPPPPPPSSSLVQNNDWHLSGQQQQQQQQRLQQSWLLRPPDPGRAQAAGPAQ